MKTKQKVKPETKVPYSRKPENISFEEWQIALRRQFAAEQKFIIKNIGDHEVFSDFEVRNPTNDKKYTIAIRSKYIGSNFCSCPDFKVSGLGTCKHVEYILNKFHAKKSLSKLLDAGYQRPYSSISLRYGMLRKVALRIGNEKESAMKKAASDYFDEHGVLTQQGFTEFESFLKKAHRIDPQFRCYPDAFDFIVSEREKQKRLLTIDQKYPNLASHKGLDNLLNIKLYPYQKEGVMNAVKAGRYIIADDMGLGKTIQAIAAAELMKKDFGIGRVLIVCPTSLKYQWKSEIEKFTGYVSKVIEGALLNRAPQYASEEFYKIVSYNAAMRDSEAINRNDFDLIILDEAQRIKNWKTKTAQSVKQLQSPYCIVLTGTPLENKLDELHSIVEFVDKYRLGLLAKFLYNHQVVDEKGKVIGYHDLNQIGQTLQPICIRRTKKEVLTQLPKRIDKTILVDVTQKQLDVHAEYADLVARLLAKWKRQKFLNEKDRQSLMIFLNCMRMVSDSTYILDQQTRHDTKIDELMILLDEVLESGEEKVVVFSQWERMTRLVAAELNKREVVFEYLHGGIPSEKRKELLDNFRNKPESKVFLSTDAGGVGLNLQSASILVNLDCPWNPAVLEQRIGRIHRLGQSKPVTIINYISRGTIEERMLELISFKQKLFDGVLDGGEDSIFMGESKMKQFMRTVETITENMPAASHIVADEILNDIKSDTEDIAEKREEATLFPPVGGEETNYGSPELPAEQENNAATQELVSSGINFLEKISQAFASKETAQRTLERFIERDTVTGKACVKIPVDDDAIQKIAGSISGLLNMLTGFSGGKN